MLPIGAYLMLGSAMECVSMIKSSKRFGDITAPAIIGCSGIMLAAVIPVFWPALAGEPYPEDCLLGRLGWPLAASLIAVFGTMAWSIPTYQPNSDSFLRAILSGWVSCYFGGGFAFAVALRMVGDNGWGLFLLVGIIVVTKFADAGAYFVGRGFGRTKLCPNVSPGKTVEGLLGGAAVASLAAWCYFSLFGSWMFEGQVLVSFASVAVLGTLLTLSGVLGDLVESIVKRETGCKDSGKLLPGLGGLWDVADSLLPSFVVGYLCVVAELVVGPGQ